MEGLAIHFSLKVTPGKPPKYTTSLSLKRCRKIWLRVKIFLNSKSLKLNNNLFHNNDGEYPLWTGYSLGYQIIRSFLKKYPKIPWQKIMKLKPKTILKKSSLA